MARTQNAGRAATRTGENHESVLNPRHRRCGKAESVASPKSVWPDADLISYGTAEMLRYEIWETAGQVAVYAGLAQKHAKSGDHVGLTYSIRCWVAVTRAAIEHLDDLHVLLARRTSEADHAK